MMPRGRFFTPPSIRNKTYRVTDQRDDKIDHLNKDRRPQGGTSICLEEK
jgi:hypothetical protein